MGLRLIWADLSNIKGQLAVRPLNFLSILIILGNLNAVLKPGDLSLGFHVSYLRRERREMGGEKKEAASPLLQPFVMLHLSKQQ